MELQIDDSALVKEYVSGNEKSLEIKEKQHYDNVKRIKKINHQLF